MQDDQLKKKKEVVRKYPGENKTWVFLCGGGEKKTNKKHGLTFAPSSTSTLQTPLHLLVLLLLLLQQLVDLPLGHGRVLGDDAVPVQAGQQQQDGHWGQTAG